MSFTNEIWFAVRSGIGDGSGSGTPSNPYAANTPTGFAAAMNASPANSLIRLLPGVFQLRGSDGNGYATMAFVDKFFIKPGQKIVGSGIFATILRFVWDFSPAGDPGQRHFM